VVFKMSLVWEMILEFYRTRYKLFWD
jgi:hypothetical protein